MDHLYIVTVDRPSEEASKESVDIDRLAFEEFSCEGRLDYNLDEERVDEILGRDAFCGGEIPEQILEKIEKAQSESIAQASYYWESAELAEAYIEFLKNKGITAHLATKKKEDWNQAWRESFQKIIVSDSLSVIPSWEAKEDNSNQIVIYPGMGFGTGNHETTYLCLLAYENLLSLLPSAHSCLDFGCGSGILGIGAIKKKKAIVDFVDIDVDALDNCVMNLEHNSYASYSEGHGVVLRDRFEATKKYDLVFANILESVLIEERSLILAALNESGILIVSGLLAEQEETIRESYTDNTGLFLQETLKKGDWIAMVFLKK